MVIGDKDPKCLLTLFSFKTYNYKQRFGPNRQSVWHWNHQENIPFCWTWWIFHVHMIIHLGLQKKSWWHDVKSSWNIFVWHDIYHVDMIIIMSHVNVMCSWNMKNVSCAVQYFSEVCHRGSWQEDQVVEMDTEFQDVVVARHSSSRQIQKCHRCLEMEHEVNNSTWQWFYV